MGVGCGYVVPSAGLVRSQGLAVSGCSSGLICALVLARLGGCDGSGPGFGAFGRCGARCRVRWRPSASGSFGDFWAGPGVAPRGGGLLGLLGQNDASDTRFVACPGKAEGRNEAEQPPALQAPPGRANGRHGACPPPRPPSPPPGKRTPRTHPAVRSPHRACRPREQSRAPTSARPRPQHGDS